MSLSVLLGCAVAIKSQFVSFWLGVVMSGQCCGAWPDNTAAEAKEFSQQRVRCRQNPGETPLPVGSNGDGNLSLWNSFSVWGITQSAPSVNALPVLCDGEKNESGKEKASTESYSKALAEHQCSILSLSLLLVALWPTVRNMVQLLKRN